ncbi:hypothetical protein [Paraburkholderia sp. HD33-4]|uniref:hypothetical protein n=1 Tax=Paraburkholderia sp. HD33-4 TaxID=2883242 RepID=UPI001F1F64D6|nr:hypothetical protein [Paraburkholderia sp. HD33-4]
MAKNLERRVDRKLAGCDARCEAESALSGRNKRAHRINPHSRSASPADPPSVEVVFYKEILDHRGFPHHCEVMRVCYGGEEKEAAVSGAIHRFEALQRVTTWKVAADGYEVVSKLTRRG